MDVLSAGWRSAYVQQAPGEGAAGEGCLFCRLAASDDAEGLVVDRSERAFTALNRFPYTAGHLMVAPSRHVPGPADLGDQEWVEIRDLLTRGQRTLEATSAPEGFNLGANLGRVAGAGVPGHVHFHLVPRWSGDTNFMTVVGETRVLPEDLGVTWERLRRALGTGST
jgi:ATP adenylyltransferase